MEDFSTVQLPYSIFSTGCTQKLGVFSSFLASMSVRKPCRSEFSFQQVDLADTIGVCRFPSAPWTTLSTSSDCFLRCRSSDGTFVRDVPHSLRVQRDENTHRCYFSANIERNHSTILYAEYIPLLSLLALFRFPITESISRLSVPLYKISFDFQPQFPQTGLCMRRRTSLRLLAND